MVIETVNIESVDFLVQKEKWHLWHVDQNYYFSADSVTIFLEQHNYSDFQFLTGADTTRQENSGSIFIKVFEVTRKTISRIT